MQNPWIRRAAYALGGLATVVVALVVAVYAVSAIRLRKTFDVPLVDVAVTTDSAALARGQHLVRVVGKCAECHGADLGGQVFIDGGPGRLVAPNLTLGGAAGVYTTAELARAIRHGVRRDGTGLKIMPSSDYNALSDQDVGAVIAYIKSLPAVRRELPQTQLYFLGRALWTAGQLPLYDADRIDHAKRQPAQVAMATGPEYGHYLADVGGCTGCHGPGLSGGKIPGTPPEWKPAANLTPTGIGAWSLDDFKRALRTGTRPNGTPIDTIMPWQASGKMTDDEIASVYAFLRTVPAKEFGNR
jgi:mono/diheme cytochrome c family protein